MENEYIALIKEGLRVYDQQWKFPASIVGILGYEARRDYTEAQSKKHARAIADRLNALRQVKLETRRTLCAQIAAEARLDRILGRQNREIVPLSAADPVDPVDPELETIVTMAAYSVMGVYYRKRGTAYGTPPTTEAFRDLIAAHDALGKSYPQDVYGMITRYITDHIHW